MFRTQNLCPGSKNVFDSRQKHFLFPSSKICFRNTFPARLNWETFACATMFPTLARPSEIKKHLHVRDFKTPDKLSNTLFCLRDWSRVL